MSASAPFPTRPCSFLLYYIRRRSLLSAGVLLTVIGGAACAVAVQYGMKMLIDALSQPVRVEHAAWLALGAFLGLIAVENVFWRLAGLLGSRAVIAMGVDIRLDLFNHLLGHGSRFFSEHLGGALANRVAATAGAASAILATLIWAIIPPLADLSGAILLLFSIDWRVAAGLFAATPLIGCTLAAFAARGRSVHRAYHDQAAEVGGEFVDVISNHWIVKAFNGRRREHERLAHQLGLEARVHRRSWMFLERVRVLHDVFLWTVAASILVFCVHRWSFGHITTGDLVIVSTLTFRTLHGARDLAFSLVGVGQQLGGIDEALRVLGSAHEIAEVPHARKLRLSAGEIAFENVGFAYPNGARVFECFSLRVRPGESVGIVGPSGAGKSSLIRLVQRLEESQQGRILIDGTSIADIAHEDLSAAIAVVPQEISLFHRSVMENIHYSRPSASDAEVFAAAAAARCDSFIRDLPAGYDTSVGERGVKLSGGERQRIGIARAILKNAPIIILDEATSALDTESEIEVQQALTALARGRTVLAVAHRLSTIAAFDRVLVLDRGCILEDGSPQQLLREHGPFARMWRLQAESLERRADYDPRSEAA